MPQPIQILLGVVALLLIAAMPLAIILGLQALAVRFARAACAKGTTGLSQSWQDRREHRRNVRALKHQVGMPIERLGADLRRLRNQIQHSEHCSATQQTAARQAYDRVLAEICAMLQLEHELDLPTMGLERDIERLRIEAVLEAHGIVIGDGRRHDRRHDQNA